MFSITEDLTKSPECEEDEWQDVEVSEEWGPQTPMTQTPMTPLNNEEEPDAYLPIRSGGGDNTRVSRVWGPQTPMTQFESLKRQTPMTQTPNTTVNDKEESDVHIFPSQEY